MRARREWTLMTVGIAFFAAGVLARGVLPIAYAPLVGFAATIVGIVLLVMALVGFLRARAAGGPSSLARGVGWVAGGLVVVSLYKMSRPIDCSHGFGARCDPLWAILGPAVFLAGLMLAGLAVVLALSGRRRAPG